MTNIYSLHGWSSGPDKEFFPWLRKEAISKGYNFVAPKLPDRYHPEDNIISILDNTIGKPTKDDYIVAHSAGAHLAVRYCEHLNIKYDGKVKIGGMALVAPFKEVNFKAVKAGIIKQLLDSNNDRLIANLDRILAKARKVSELWGKVEFNWDKIRQVSSNNICLFSDNDPFVLETEHHIFEKGLLAKIKVFKDAGHFNTDDGFVEFDYLKKVLFGMILENK